MAVNQKEPLSEQLKQVPQVVPGWTKIHSWIFVILVAAGLALIAFQNRYHYIMPDTTGKAFRISKLTGAVQEYDPSVGWMSAQISGNAPIGSSPTSNDQEPTVSEPSAVPMTVPPGTRPETVPTQGSNLTENTSSQPNTSAKTEEPSSGSVSENTVSSQPGSQPSTSVQTERTSRPSQPTSSAPLSREEKYRTFKEAFPDYGEPEFELASEDLFPEWRQRVAPNGTWQQFLSVYKEFIDWWTAQGQPQESGMKLWQKFLASRNE